MLRYLLLLLALPCLAQEKTALPRFTDTRICPAGQALTWTIQCDPGSRAPVDRIWNPPAPGVELCRATPVGCTPIPRYTGIGVRPGFEVQDTPGAPLASVSFGLGTLLGEEP